VVHSALRMILSELSPTEAAFLLVAVVRAVAALVWAPVVGVCAALLLRRGIRIFVGRHRAGPRLQPL
jgi:hypothetical protein